MTLEQALELLAQPKGTRRAGRGKQVLRTFDPSPVTGQPVQLFSGRYGPYVADGTTNASLPRGMTPDELTFERALDLLAERAAAGAIDAGRGARANGPRRRPPSKPKAAEEESQEERQGGGQGRPPRRQPRRPRKKKAPAKRHDAERPATEARKARRSAADRYAVLSIRYSVLSTANCQLG